MTLPDSSDRQRRRQARPLRDLTEDELHALIDLGEAAHLMRDADELSDLGYFAACELAERGYEATLEAHRAGS